MGCRGRGERETGEGRERRKRRRKICVSWRLACFGKGVLNKNLKQLGGIDVENWEGSRQRETCDQRLRPQQLVR